MCVCVCVGGGGGGGVGVITDQAQACSHHGTCGSDTKWSGRKVGILHCCTDLCRSILLGAEDSLYSNFKGIVTQIEVQSLTLTTPSSTLWPSLCSLVLRVPSLFLLPSSR